MAQYENVWSWTGKTRRSVVTSGRSLTWPVDPFPKAQVIAATKIAILAETTAKFQEEMANLGITTTVTRIDPVVEVEVKSECRQYRDYTICTWYHWLHMSADVYFTSDKPMKQVGLAIDPVTLAALVKVLQFLIVVVAAGLVIYGIAKVFIESFFTETHTIKTHSPDCTWTEETITTPKFEMGIWIVATAGMVAGIIALPSIIKAVRK